ncbi:MAG: hypothetical protein UU85_C0004G0136 [Candidatus Wolfebacteria bacterium GW2011_GWA2_42_10]|uniref:Uncharacterized protein n=2 Tax=Candidatus Wolfeibacteriota TaxID=1752735 RepID=A0A0G0XLN6_9BACT|nr:MAG: hypothetical protein UU38_C0001G0197 [Candidatus Wolfebacteria bacterium GW2011_GWB1_41_12]KKS25377.1 MAG: hypothetical protein UU85_C0004G0136 [Candidatus Wolfebacteria bacterium GW2011_GWA2_42_10]KKT56816.1 MAG: hypothetical protein UW50_C0001G0385 [Candidatus Wolfebacteria bacterium GW2011_GWA1_44_24]
MATIFDERIHHRKKILKVLLDIYDEFKGRSAKNLCEICNIQIITDFKQKETTAYLRLSERGEKPPCKRVVILPVSNCQMWLDFLTFHELGHHFVLLRQPLYVPYCGYMRELLCDVFAITMLFASLGNSVANLRDMRIHFLDLGRDVYDKKEEYSEWIKKIQNSLHFYLDTRLIKCLRQDREMGDFWRLLGST